MKRTHLGLQAAIILAMVAFVSWPQFRPVRTQSVWRYVPSAVLQAKTEDAARFADADHRPAMNRDQISLTDALQRGAANGPGAASNPAFQTSAALAAVGARLNALVGVARTSLNMPIPFARVVLRNIGTGQVFARTVANEHGVFSFLDLDANTYLVELLDGDGSVVATSSLLTMARGAAAAGTVAVSFGNNAAPTLPQVTTVAVSNDVTRTSAALQTQESPR